MLESKFKIVFGGILIKLIIYHNTKHLLTHLISKYVTRNTSKGKPPNYFLINFQNNIKVPHPNSYLDTKISQFERNDFSHKIEQDLFSNQSLIKAREYQRINSKLTSLRAVERVVEQ